MSFDDWEKRADGNIATNPLMGWDIASFPGHGIVRLQYAETPQDVMRGQGLHLQVGMTAAQSRELGEALLRLAEKTEARSGG